MHQGCQSPNSLENEEEDEEDEEKGSSHISSFGSTWRFESVSSNKHSITSTTFTPLLQLLQSLGRQVSSNFTIDIKNHSIY